MSKTPTPKAATKEAPAKAPAKTAKPKAEGAATSAFAKPLTPSKELAAVVGAAPLPRTEVVKKVWEYIKKHDLQDPKDKRQIIADETLKPVFDGVARLSMFDMNKHLAKHLK